MLSIKSGAIWAGGWDTAQGEGPERLCPTFTRIPSTSPAVDTV